MINNLSSVFDPSSSILVISNWISMAILLIMVPPLFWIIPNPSSLIVRNVKNTLHKEMKTLLGVNSPVGATILLVGVFYFILINNFMGLFPYIFTGTSHIVTTLTLSLPLWVSFILFGWVNHTTHILAHLVPQGTPPALISFIVVIETVRNIIRPGTLAIRLSANIIAGHLLLTLLGNQTAASSFLVVSSLLVVQILLLTLESAVAIIQSYVFMVLSTLYSSESSAH